MKNNLIYILLGGGILYYFFSKNKKTTNVDTVINPLDVLLTTPTTNTTTTTTKPNNSVVIPSNTTVNTLPVVKDPYFANQTINAKMPYQNIKIYDLSFKNILGTTNTAKFIKAYGTNKNVLQVETTVQKGIYNVPTKIVGYTESKYWN